MVRRKGKVLYTSESYPLFCYSQGSFYHEVVHTTSQHPMALCAGSADHILKVGRQRGPAEGKWGAEVCPQVEALEQCSEGLALTINWQVVEEGQVHTSTAFIHAHRSHCQGLSWYPFIVSMNPWILMVWTEPARRCLTSTFPSSQGKPTLYLPVAGWTRQRWWGVSTGKGRNRVRHMHTGRKTDFRKNTWGPLESTRSEIKARDCILPTSGEYMCKAVQRLGCFKWMPCQKTLVKI